MESLSFKWISKLIFHFSSVYGKKEKEEKKECTIIPFLYPSLHNLKLGLPILGQRLREMGLKPNILDPQKAQCDSHNDRSREEGGTNCGNSKWRRHSLRLRSLTLLLHPHPPTPPLLILSTCFNLALSNPDLPEHSQSAPPQMTLVHILSLSLPLSTYMLIA